MQLALDDAATTTEGAEGEGGGALRNLDKAAGCLNEILTHQDMPALQEMARYWLAKCHEARAELMGQGGTDDVGSPEMMKAMACYEAIYNGFKTDRDNGVVRDSHYYLLSVFDLTRIYERLGDVDSLRKDARVYEDLARNHPGMARAGEAGQKARIIREKIGD